MKKVHHPKGEGGGHSSFNVKSLSWCKDNSHLGKLFDCLVVGHLSEVGRHGVFSFAVWFTLLIISKLLGFVKLKSILNMI